MDGLTAIIVVFVVLDLVLAAGMMKIAQDKGRSPVAAFFAVLLFGLLAVVYYALVGDTTEVRVRKEEAVRKKLREEEAAR